MQCVLTRRRLPGDTDSMQGPTRGHRSRTRLLVVTLVAAVAAALACAQTRPLFQPPPIAAGATPAQTRVAIVRALVDNDWTVESERPGEITASYGGTEWSMVVAISYGEQVAVRYVSSENLEYDDSQGAPVIHGGYNKRVQRLQKEIGQQIALLELTDPLPSVASPPPAGGSPD